MKLQLRTSLIFNVVVIVFLTGFAAFAAYNYCPDANKSLLFKCAFGVFVVVAIGAISYLGSHEFIFFASQTQRVFRFEQMTSPTTLHFSQLPDFHEYALLIVCEPIYQAKPNTMRSFRLGKLPPQPPVLKYWVKLFGHHEGATKSLPGKTFEHIEDAGENGDYRPKRKEEILEIPSGFDEYSLDFVVEVQRQRLSWKQLKVGTPENEAVKEPFTLEVSLAVALNLRQALAKKTLVNLSKVESPEMRL